ncbi:MAG: hypothetical protein ABSA80_05055 [Terriglobales bacterium]
MPTPVELPKLENTIQIKPVRRDGAVHFIDAIGLSLTLDHQIIDGARDSCWP